MKILIIYTGGTIGSRLKDNLISTDRKQNRELFDEIQGVEFDYTEPYFILSEQLSGKNLTALIKCVGENLSKNYDGIIVTHGTDTLQYSAGALSLAFGKCKIPVVLVSSNYILDEIRANGKDNFKFAVEFMKEGIGGVFVSYKNTGSKAEIHLGSKLLPHEIYTDDVKSLGEPFGFFEKGKFIRIINNFSCDNIEQFRLNEFSPVLWLSVYAGMKEIDAKGYKAVLLQGYHSGTLPTLSREFISFCKNTNVPIYFLGATDGNTYESTKLFDDIGIQVLPKLSPIYAYIKLWAVYDNQLRVDKIFNTTE